MIITVFMCYCRSLDLVLTDSGCSSLTGKRLWSVEKSQSTKIGPHFMFVPSRKFTTKEGCLCVDCRREKLEVKSVFSSVDSQSFFHDHVVSSIQTKNRIATKNVTRSVTMHNETTLIPSLWLVLMFMLSVDVA